jgi:hypothetical protein
MQHYLAIPLNNDTVTPGALCLGIVVLMGVVLFFLLRNMNKQIGRIQAPKEADLKQAEWEAQQAEKARQAD